MSVLHVILVLWPPAARFVFLLVLYSFCFCCSYLFFVNQSRAKSEGWSTINEFKSLINFIAGRPKAALLFWFFGGFRCGVPLFTVILVIY